MEVDFFTGRSRAKEYGPGRYSSNLIASLKEAGLDGRIISYPLRYHFPFSKLWLVSAYYSAIAQFRKRKNSIKHITTQEQAYILNLVNLKPCVVTCHDVIPLVRKEDYSSLESRALSKLCYRGMMKAERLITDSYNSKTDIVKYLGYPEDRIDVIYLGVDLQKYKPQTVDRNYLQKYGIHHDDKYLLYVGNEHPRKNLDGLIKAFAQLKQKRQDLKLVKVGPPYWKGTRSRLKDLIHELNLDGEVLFTSYVSEEELVMLYNGAELFVFPSLYEGFGNSPLEAMACGTPVVTSDVSSLGEVYSQAALTVDPYNIEAISEAMFQVVGNGSLRQELVKKGLEMAKELSWEKTARETLEVYEKFG